MDNSTIYLILALSGFVFIVVLLIHQHNCSDSVRRKQGEVKGITRKLQPRIEILEKEVIDLKMKIEEIDEQIANFQ